MTDQSGTPSNTIFAVHSGAAEPLYVQLIDQVKRLIAAGQLAPGDLLPSVRDVAESLAINPMTVSRAYGRLESEGMVTRRSGIGMVVAPTAITTQGDANRIALLSPTLERAAMEAQQLGISDVTASKLFLQILKRKKP